MPRRRLAPHEEQAVLDDLKVATLTKDPRLMTRAEFAATCICTESSDRLVLTRLIRSVLWYVVRGIREGRVDPIRGNVRTLWYLWLKPVLAHLPDDDLHENDPYDEMIQALAALVTEHRLLSYVELGIEDENGGDRALGDRDPTCVVFAELPWGLEAESLPRARLLARIAALL